MNPRQFLRAMKHLAGDVIPWQLIDVLRGRDYDRAVIDAADQLADEEVEYETLEPHVPPAGVDATPPVVPPAGSNLIDLIAEVLTDHGISYGECLAPVIAEALEASLAARLAPPE